MQPSSIYVATGNRGKLREFAAIFAAYGIAANAFDDYAEPAEGAVSYEANAALKARTLAAQLRAAGIEAAVVADDSGLEIAALNGGPGVLSARFGGPGATWAERRDLIVAAADRAGVRDARFVCALHYIAPDGSEVAVRANLTGSIPEVERGDGGFSYDAVFVYPGRGLTFAEMNEAEKNRVSHRARAVEELLCRLGTKMGAGGM